MERHSFTDFGLQKQHILKLHLCFIIKIIVSNLIFSTSETIIFTWFERELKAATILVKFPWIVSRLHIFWKFWLIIANPNAGIRLPPRIEQASIKTFCTACKSKFYKNQISNVSYEISHYVEWVRTTVIVLRIWLEVTGCPTSKSK